jgi:hypothetical protein
VVSTLMTDSAGSTPTDTIVFPLDHVTRSQLAKLSGKSEMFWIRLERARKGPPITRLGKTPLYRLSAVRAWLEAQSGG